MFVFLLWSIITLNIWSHQTSMFFCSLIISPILEKKRCAKVKRPLHLKFNFVGRNFWYSELILNIRHSSLCPTQKIFKIVVLPLHQKLNIINLRGTMCRTTKASLLNLKKWKIRNFLFFSFFSVFFFWFC